MIEHLCLILGAIVLLNAEETYDTKYVCGNEYPMDSVKSMYLNYDGHDVGTEKCEIGFTVADSSDYTICVQPISLNLDCGTTIQYQEHFVAENINDGELECSMNSQSSYEENCVNYVEKFFIVIEKKNPPGYIDFKALEKENPNWDTEFNVNKKDYPPWNTDESASFHVFAWEKPSFSTSSSGLIGFVAIAPILVIVLICVTCIRWQRRQRLMNTNTQVVYNTSVSATAVPTGGVSQYPVTLNQQAYPQSGYPQSGYPQSAGPGNPVQQSAGGYYVHPTVTAYPAQNPALSGPYYYQPVPQPLDGGMQATPAMNPSAPPPDDKSLPPPSYESLLNK